MLFKRTEIILFNNNGWCEHIKNTLTDPKITKYWKCDKYNNKYP